MILPEVFFEKKRVFLLCLGCNCSAKSARTRQAAGACQCATNPITQSERGLYSVISGAVVKAAEKMPEENYSFKPTPEVRSFGQLVGHVADANYMFCSEAAGEANPMKDIEKTKTSKADLVTAIKGAVCVLQ